MAEDVETGPIVEKIDAGAAAVQKNVSEFRESQQSAKPAWMSQPEAVIVPPAAAAQTQGTAPQTQAAPIQGTAAPSDTE